MTEIATIDRFGRLGTSVFSENTAIFLNFLSKMLKFNINVEKDLAEVKASEFS